MATSKQQHSDLKVDVSLLQQDMENMHKYCDKMDVTINKIEELLQTMVRMCQLHEERINNHQKDDESFRSEIKEILKTRKEEVASGFDKLEKKIDQIKDELSAEISASKKSLHKLSMFKYGAVLIGSLLLWILSTVTQSYIYAWFQTFHFKH